MRWVVIFFAIAVAVLVILLTVAAVCRSDDFNSDAIISWFNTLFTGFAFAAFIVALFMQREELHLTRQEMEESTAALEASGAALRHQATIFNETAYLNGLNALREFYANMLHLNQPAESVKYGPRLHLVHELIEEMVTSVGGKCGKGPIDFDHVNPKNVARYLVYMAQKWASEWRAMNGDPRFGKLEFIEKYQWLTGTLKLFRDQIEDDEFRNHVDVFLENHPVTGANNLPWFGDTTVKAFGGLVQRLKITLSNMD